MTTDERLARLQRLLLIAAAFSIVAFAGLAAVNLEQDLYQRTQRAEALDMLIARIDSRSQEHAIILEHQKRVLRTLREHGCVVPKEAD